MAGKLQKRPTQDAASCLLPSKKRMFQAQGEYAQLSGRSCDLEKEVSVKTDWARVLQARTPPASLQARQLHGEEAWLVEGLLSPEECQALIHKSEEHGFGPTDFVKSYRGNLRLTATDPGLAEAVWERLKALVPASFKLTTPAVLGDANWWSHYPDVDGIWDASGLNNCWRLAKYYPGDQFRCHCDGAFEKVAGAEMSMLSATIYLNDGFEGGRTRFYLTEDPYFEYQTHFGVPDFEVVPKAGSCLIFRQPPGKTYWHDGAKLRSGQKYLLRSDVMYSKRSRR